MNSIKDILNMVFTEAVEGNYGANNHYFDEFRNREFIKTKSITSENPAGTHKSANTSLKPYDVGLVKNPVTGEIHWSK